MNLNYRRKKRERHHEASHDDAESTTPPLAHALVPKGDVEWIDDAAALTEFLEHVKSQPLFAFDTEFIGEESYWPKICVVQLATPERIALVDAIAISDLTPVYELVCAEEHLTIVHAGGQDLEPAQRAVGSAPKGVIDVQICAAFAEMPWPAGLEKLVDHFAEHRITKGHTFTNWDARPLTASQLRYAADDVRYLPLVWETLKARLTERGTLPWALRECEDALRLPKRYDEEGQIRRILKVWPMRPTQLPVLRKVLALRDESARIENLPQRVTMPDEAIMELARQKPDSLEQLQGIKGIPKRLLYAYSDRVLAAIADGASLPAEKLPAPRIKEETATDRARVDALVAISSMRCLAQGLAPGMVFSRSDISTWWLERNSKAAPSVFTAGDWRSDALGLWLAEFVEGESAFSIRWTNDAPTIAP